MAFPASPAAAAGFTIIPTVADAYSTRLAALAGYDTVLLGLEAVANTLLGAGDAALVTLTEMEFLVARAVAATRSAVIADIGTGFGNAINVVHAVKVLEKAGAAGVLIEDRISPAQRTRSDDRRLLPTGEMTGKLHAALDSRSRPGFLVMVCSRAAGDVDALAERGAAYARAGADIFIPDPDCPAGQLQSLAGRLKTACKIFGCLSALTSGADLQRMGCHGALAGPVLIQAQVLGIQKFLHDFRQRDNEADLQLLRDLEGSPMEDWYEFTGFDGIRALEERYLPAEEVTRRYSGTHADGYYQPQAAVKERP